MKRMLLLCVLLASTTALAKETQMDITVQQSTQANLDGTMVGIRRIGAGETYPLADGTQKKGVIAKLSIADGRDLTVGAGSAFDIGAHRYEVVAVTDGTPRGTVTFRRVH